MHRTFAVLASVASAEIVARSHHALVIRLLVVRAAAVDDAGCGGDADVERTPGVLRTRVGDVRVVALAQVCAATLASSATPVCVQSG